MWMMLWSVEEAVESVDEALESVGREGGRRATPPSCTTLLEKYLLTRLNCLLFNTVRERETSHT